MAKRLWDKGENINKKVHEFTVGDDPITDLEIVSWDLVASAAHAKMLSAVNLLNKADCNKLLTGLKNILQLHEEGKFEIPTELEDCHTAIESLLSAEFGEAGKRIHTGRSRNDQVMVTVRLYLKDQLALLLESLSKCAEALLARAEEFGHIPMPGYTHFQPAMPASVAMWLQAFGETAIELITEGLALSKIIDCNPLGAASGFGTNLPLDRELTTKLLNFNRTQRNPIAVQNSRGCYEIKVLRWAVDVASLIEKFSIDLILFTTREYGFFSLPTELTTGSSIMPQKKNPDVLELLRAKAGKVRAAETELNWIIAKLPSSYHRDFQYTKEPLVRGIKHINSSIEMFFEAINSFTVNKESLEKAMTVDLYATYEAFNEVKAGKAFRDAYKSTAEKIKSGTLDLKNLKKEFAPIAKQLDQERALASSELSGLKVKIAGQIKDTNNLKQSIFSNVK